MKPMHFAMALLSAAMFFVLAGVFMGVQLELDGTKLVVGTAADIRWQWVFIGTAVVFFLPVAATDFPEKPEGHFRGLNFVLPAIGWLNREAEAVPDWRCWSSPSCGRLWCRAAPLISPR
ncbi:leucine/isoleucine/valine transporter permease subunit [Citrobacter koseri]|uniref:Leucine/isoleucine/valine transporter permease subunit n=1 Tax=Citrobacter koseri TaxID=545 RepID=A0A2X2YG34_CITKO|nr:leucine/isoleucine/valine transporter permease subunit [Citrobacter koseri]